MVVLALAVLAAVFILLMVLAPFLLRNGSVLGWGGHAAGAFLCHQIDERSFAFNGIPLGVCARCSGLYAGGIAGLCDPSGRLFGLMPHPECYLHRTHHPRWTRLTDLPEEGLGLLLFKNAVKFLSSSST